MDNIKVDHIGVAVESIDKSMEFYRAMGWENIDIEEVPTEKVRVGFIPFDNKANIELIEPTSDESVIFKFLKKKGPGLHHVCFRVSDIQSHIDNLKSRGVRLIDDVPRPGAHGCKVAFVHPSSTGGVLIELSEKV